MAEGISIADYSANLAQFGMDVRAAGGQPLFVTPLSKRNFNSSGLVIEDLAWRAQGTLDVANYLSASVMDLNKASTDLLNNIGEHDAWLFNLTPTDFVHLNEYGGAVFGNTISILMRKLRTFNSWTTPSKIFLDIFRDCFEG